MLGHTIIGHGDHHVLVLHDWFCDRSSWEPTLPYLERDAFTYVFADLRGYGASKGVTGAYDVDEAATDVGALARHLGWQRFSLVGHSMTSLVVQRLAQLMPDSVSHLALVTPIGPMGLQLPEEALRANQALARASAAEQFAQLSAWWGDRLGKAWIHFKIERWRATADVEAVAKYAEMWGRADISGGAASVKAKVMAIAGTYDAPYFQADFLAKSLLSFYPGARAETIEESSHYPMQETPPLLAATIQKFLAEPE